MIIYVLMIWILIMSLVSFVMFGVDKHRAVEGEWRIPEKTLLMTAGIGGGVGALFGMRIFHHKTQKIKFKIVVPICAMLWILLAAWMYIKLK